MVVVAVPVDPDWRGDRPRGRQPRQGGVLLDHPSLPSELHLCEADGGGERQLGDFNPW